MRLGNTTIEPKACEDHINLWANTLSEWMPDTIFDAHVHLCPPDAVEPFSAARLREPLSTFGSLEWEEYRTFCADLFQWKTIAGQIAFPLPMREVDISAGNAYIRNLMKHEPTVKGFALAHPTDAAATVTEIEQAMADGVRYTGVKPYFDLLGKSNYCTTMPEFIPDGLLAFMDSEALILMLHTSGRGMGVEENQDYIRCLLDKFPRVRVILAHMGRFLEVEEFFRFADSDIFAHPNLYLGMSSVTRKDVYIRALQEPSVCDRLLFGTDLPFGLITGVEAWSEETGPVFITRDRYQWTSDVAQRMFASDLEGLTYNTYHVIQAFKDALETVVKDEVELTRIRKKVFCDNAEALLRA